MFYSYYQSAPYEYDELEARGICSASPVLSSLQEILLIYLKELSFYLLKLKDLGATNEIIRDNVIEAISGIITNVDYNQEQFQQLLFNLGKNLSQSKALYVDMCRQNNFEAKYLRASFRQPKKFDITDILRKGEQYYIKRNIEYTHEQKTFFDIMLILVKNLCIRIIQIKSYKKNYDSAYNAILTLLNAMNFENFSEVSIKKIIADATADYYGIVKSVTYAQEEAHGQRESVYISFAPRNGKAILVSGIDMTQLEAILESTKDRGVDVYTHGITMLMAHTLAKFKTYPHLVGHFGKGFDNSLFDFAAFPGAILMTRYLFQKVEYLYRGRLFTTDSFAPSGIVKIVDNNFEPLIKAALDSKGFTKKQQELIHRVGFKQQEMENRVESLIEKMNKNEIKHLYIIGLLNQENDYSGYFEKFLSIMPKDCYALSLSHEKNEENILHVDSFYDYLFIYRVLDKFNEIRPLNELNISIFITKCDQYTVTNIINFINMGVKSIYLCKCVPSLISPTMVNTMKKIFNVKEITTPEEDLNMTLSG